MNYLAAATEYVLERGWSVIPVNADKRPALSSWEGYQRKRPSPKEFRQWFGERQPVGLAVLTGALSRLVVLDIDSREVEQRFAAAFPDLLETRRVRTPGRSGLHLYFATDRLTGCPSRKFPGADLKADGGYVVAPPSVFPTGQYLLELDRPPRLLSGDELQQIINWFEAEQQPDSRVDASTLPVTVTDAPAALALYQRAVSKYGSRELGLFVTACQLRDRGWTADAVEGSLAIAHVLMPHPAGAVQESDQQRRKEASSAIRSAFKYPVRPVYQRPANVIGVAYSDNAAREALLQLDVHQGTAFWRCYDALTIQGVQPGEVLSYSELYTTLRPYGIGRRAVDQFVGFVVGGAFLVSRAERPSPPPPHAGAGIDPNHSDLKDFKNIEVHTTKRSLIRGRRAEPRYIIPTLEAICAALRIRRSPADAITRADVESPVAYRRALQKAFIQRRAGIYSLGLLAQRLGVSARTIQRYHVSTGVQQQPTFATVEELSLATLDHVLHSVPSTGSHPYYLQNEYGDRFGARLETAEWLLRKGQRVWLMRRSFNWYWIGALPAALQTALPCPVEAEQEAEQIRLRGERLWAIATAQELQLSGELPPQSILATPIHVDRPAPLADLPPAPIPKPPNRRTRRFYRKPLTGHYEEWTAKKLYELNAGVSMINARRLVDTYGVDAVMKTIDRARPMLAAGKLKAPGGFIITTVQMVWRKLYPAHRLNTPKFTPDKRKVKSA